MVAVCRALCSSVAAYARVGQGYPSQPKPLPQDLCIMYTSGTTGEPKGAARHANVIATVAGGILGGAVFILV